MKQYVWFNIELRRKKVTCDRLSFVLVMLVLALTVFKGFTWYGLVGLVLAVCLSFYGAYLRKQDTKQKIVGG